MGAVLGKGVSVRPAGRMLQARGVEESSRALLRGESCLSREFSET